MKQASSTPKWRKGYASVDLRASSHGGLAPLARLLRRLRPRRRPPPPQGLGRMGARSGGQVRGVTVGDGRNRRAVRDRCALQRHVVRGVGNRCRRRLHARGAADRACRVRRVAARQPQGPRCEAPPHLRLCERLRRHGRRGRGPLHRQVPRLWIHYLISLVWDGAFLCARPAMEASLLSRASSARAQGLQRLCLLHCKPMTDLGLGCIIVGCLDLRGLTLNWCLRITDSGVQLLGLERKKLLALKCKKFRICISPIPWRKNGKRKRKR